MGRFQNHLFFFWVQWNVNFKTIYYNSSINFSYTSFQTTIQLLNKITYEAMPCWRVVKMQKRGVKGRNSWLLFPSPTQSVLNLFELLQWILWTQSQTSKGPICWEKIDHLILERKKRGKPKKERHATMWNYFICIDNTIKSLIKNEVTITRSPLLCSARQLQPA